jgi:hypothetical protein
MVLMKVWSLKISNKLKSLSKVTFDHSDRCCGEEFNDQINVSKVDELKVYFLSFS